MQDYFTESMYKLKLGATGLRYVAFRRATLRIAWRMQYYLRSDIANWTWKKLSHVGRVLC